MIAKFLSIAAAVSITATPALAAPANPAATLSVAKSTRAATGSTRKNELYGGGLIVAAVAAAAVVAGIIVIADDDDDDDDSDSN